MSIDLVTTQPSVRAGSVLRDVAVDLGLRRIGRVASDGDSTPSASPLMAEDGAVNGRDIGEDASGVQALHPDLEAATDLARKDGFEAGYADGLARGRDAANEALERRMALLSEDNERRVQRLETLIESLSRQSDELCATVSRETEQELIALCHAAICRIVGDATIRFEVTAAVVREAIDQWLRAGSMSSGPVEVRVHPHDLELLNSDRSLSARLSSVSWVADESVQLGGCIVSGEHGRLDARLETQLATIRELLLEAPAAAIPATAPSAEGSA